MFTPHIIFFFFGSQDLATTEVGLAYTAKERLHFTVKGYRLHYVAREKLHFSDKRTPLHWVVRDRLGFTEDDD